MAILRVRYKTGDTDEWELHERQNAEELMRHLFKAAPGNDIVGFSFASRDAKTPSDYGFICLRMGDVSMWEVDGLTDDEELLKVWGLE